MLKHAQSQTGFTLTELMISVALMVIIASLALPAFGTMIQNYRIRAATEAILSGLQLARAEAVRQNTRVRFVLGPETGWTVSTDAGATIETRPAGEGSGGVIATRTPSDATSTTYNAFGRIAANADASATLTQVDLDISDATKELRVVVSSPGGQIRMCDPSVTSAADPRKC